MRLADKVAIVFGAGQTPGETIGNGRATALLFAREGARVLAVDRDLDSARETVKQIAADGTDAAAVEAAIAECVSRFRRIDILHNNVGVSLTGGDAPLTEITTDA